MTGVSTGGGRGVDQLLVASFVIPPFTRHHPYSAGAECSWAFIEGRGVEMVATFVCGVCVLLNCCTDAV